MGSSPRMGCVNDHREVIKQALENDVCIFAPLDGTSVIFETGPKAKEHIAEVKGVTIEPAGEGADGFARYRITL